MILAKKMKTVNLKTFLSDEEVELEDIEQIVDDILVTSPNTLQESRN